MTTGPGCYFSYPHVDGIYAAWSPGVLGCGRQRESCEIAAQKSSSNDRKAGAGCEVIGVVSSVGKEDPA